MNRRQLRKTFKFWKGVLLYLNIGALEAVSFEDVVEYYTLLTFLDKSKENIPNYSYWFKKYFK